MSKEEVLEKIKEELPQWVYKDGYIVREINTKSWKETVMLFNAIAYLAEGVWHHPDVELSFKKLKIKLKTHEANAITEKDFNLAKLIERLISLTF
ncbi:4a-hydroxytetrahydrobiopterin dehydratase [Thermocrinis sp.]